MARYLHPLWPHLCTYFRPWSAICIPMAMVQHVTKGTWLSFALPHWQCSSSSLSVCVQVKNFFSLAFLLHVCAIAIPFLSSTFTCTEIMFCMAAERRNHGRLRECVVLCGVIHSLIIRPSLTQEHMYSESNTIRSHILAGYIKLG